MSQVSLALSDPISTTAPSRRTPRTKRDHLEVMQLAAGRYRKEFNARRVAYRGWHEHKPGSFIEALKRVQCLAHSAAAPAVASVADFRELRAAAMDLKRLGRQRQVLAANLDQVDEFLNHWRDYLALKEDFDAGLTRPLAGLLESTDAFRYPAMKANVLALIEQLDAESNERFDFSRLHNPTDNLFTYRVSVRDERFLGLMQILPRVLQVGSQICYFTEQLVMNESDESGSRAL